MEDYTKGRKRKVDNNVSGIVYGNVSNASTIYGEEKFHASRGHGFAAERANHLHDKLTGHDAKIVGDDNAKNGADRIVDGIQIQTKYCSSGSKCVAECFENNKFRYFDSSNNPMQIEVPKDMYDDAVRAMENRIKTGQVEGVTNPDEAKNIIRKGSFTYEQARNIAKAGTVESILYDATNGAIVATSAFGISTTIAFATSLWNGDDFDIAIKKATVSGLKVGGTTFISAILAGQMTKAGLNSMLVGSSEAIINILGPKASAVLVNAFRSGTNIYGAAAMKSAAKMLRGNAITGAATIVVLSSVDIVNIFRGRISGKQLFKNLTNTTATVAGGTAGWIVGAGVGASVGSVVPVVGTAIGTIAGIAGSLIGGKLSSKASDSVMSHFIEDDAVEMQRILEEEFQKKAIDYLLGQREVEQAVEILSQQLDGGTLKDMFASGNQHQFADNLIQPIIDEIVENRQRVSLPSIEDMQKGLKIVLEELADSDDSYEYA